MDDLSRSVRPLPSYAGEAEHLYNAYRASFRRRTLGTLPRWKYVRPRVKAVWLEMARNLDASDA